jgi:fatty acid desaturase
MGRTNEPLHDVRKSFQVPWYRCPIEPAVLREHTRRSDAKGLLQAAGILLVLAALAALTWYFFGLHIWAGFAVSLFLFGTACSFTAFACHELSHGTVFRTKWLNAFFLRVFALLGWFNFHHYRASHTYHHLYTLHPRGDREVVLPKYPSLEPLYLLQLFTFSVTGGFESPGLVPQLRSFVRLAFRGSFADEWSQAIFQDEPAALRRAVRWARFFLAFHAALIAVSVVLHLWMLPVLVTFGGFIANWWRYFVGVPMHCGLRDNVADFRLCVRTITLDPVSRFLYWNMNWHMEHHMFAAVPTYSLGRLHRTLAGDLPRPRTLGEAWREMRQTWKRQQTEPAYQFDTPLPGQVKGRSTPQTPEAGSLGDLDR